MEAAAGTFFETQNQVRIPEGRGCAAEDKGEALRAVGTGMGEGRGRFLT